MEKTAMYTLHDYARMIADDARTGAYVRALAEVIRPGSIVADLGTGTGVLALVACRLGAGRVYAIDMNDAIEVGRQLARENGVADRIVFIQKDVREVQLPERVDVIVSDLRGVFPLHGDHLAVVADVRSRFLKNSGVLLPARDRLMAGVVGNAKLYEWALGPSHGPLGISLSAMRERLRHAACRDREADPLLPENILSTTAAWADIEYATVRPEPITGRASLRLEREGTGHGVALWFEAELARDGGFSSAPGHELCYGRLFLPWPRPTPLREGDDVVVEIWAQPDGEPLGWTSTVYGADGVRESFKQSSLLSLPSKPVGRSGSDGAGRLSQVGRS